MCPKSMAPIIPRQKLSRIAKSNSSTYVASSPEHHMFSQQTRPHCSSSTSNRGRKQTPFYGRQSLTPSSRCQYCSPKRLSCRSERSTYIDASIFPASHIVDRNNTGKDITDLSTATVTLQEARLTFTRIPKGKVLGVTDESYLVIQCTQFVTSKGQTTTEVIGNPTDILKDHHIRRYVEGLRRDGGGGYVDHSCNLSIAH